MVRNSSVAWVSIAVSSVISTPPRRAPGLRRPLGLLAQREQLHAKTIAQEIVQPGRAACRAAAPRRPGPARTRRLRASDCRLRAERLARLSPEAVAAPKTDGAL